MVLEYILFFLFLIIFLVLPDIKNSFWIGCAIPFLFLLETRLSGFQSDFQFSYIYSLDLTLSKIFSNLYYSREFLYWSFSSLLHSITRIPEITFLIIDCIIIMLINKIRKYNYLPSYVVLGVLLSFPSVLGIQNIYRQYIATILLLFIFFSPIKKQIIKFLIFLLPIVVHNFVLLFVFFFLKSPKVKALYLILLSFFILTLSTFKSSIAETGGNYEYLYFLLLLIHFLVWKFKKLKIPKEIAMNTNTLIGFICLILLLPSSQAERIYLSLLLITYFITARTIYKSVKQKNFALKLYTIFLILPAFFFTSIKNFIS